MRYIPARRLYFIHIPKCAGKSVHAALKQEQASYESFAYDLKITQAEAEALALSQPDPKNVEQTFEAGYEVNGFGTVHPSHLPLFVIAQALPATWNTLIGAQFSFAMTRDPRERFLSALMQRMKEFGDAGAIRADDTSVAEEAEKVCTWLDGRGRFADLEYVHFIPQRDFVFLEDERILTHVFPVDRTDVLSHVMQRETGLTVNIPRTHARRQPKSWARTIQPAARFAARNLMPHPVKRMLYPIWTGSAVFDDASSTYQGVDLGSDVETFLAHYYADDAALHNEALAHAQDVDASLREAS